MTREQVAGALSEDAPGMTDEEIGWLPRPGQPAGRAARDAAATGAVPGQRPQPHTEGEQ